MKRIIVYGIYGIELRRQIEFHLDRCRYEIIGFTDRFYNEDIVDGKRFFLLEELSAIEFNYIVLAIVDGVDETIELLKRYGVVKEQIVFPEILLWNNSAKRMPNLVRRIKGFSNVERIDALMFGLSYSYRCINKKSLSVRCFDYSAFGLDMYYNFKLYDFTKENRSDVLENVKYIFMVFPFYYFDYDMSASPSQYSSGQIFSVRELDDWHNAEKANRSEEYIVSYGMFGESISEFYNLDSPRMVWDTYNGLPGKGSLQHIWWKHYPKTSAENVRLMNKYVNEFVDNGWRPVMIIPPIYYKGMDELSVQAYEIKYEYFYSCVNERIDSAIELWDYSEKYPDERPLFYNIDHLNYYGRDVFSSELNSRMLIEGMRGNVNE